MITKQQALTLDTFHHPVPNMSKCAVWRRNGMTQTWVTRPEEYRVPVKYGLRAYGNITRNEADLVFAPSDCPACHGTKH